MSPELSVFVEKLTALRRQATPLKTLDTQALFAALLKNGLLRQAGAEVYGHTTRLADAYTQAVDLGRRGALAEALAQLHRTDEALAALPAGMGEFAELFQLSAWGYYYYKTGESAQGFELLRRGLGLSAALERRGYPALVYRRIEQLQNLARLHSQSQQPELTQQLLKNTLTYLHSGQASGLFIADWDAAAIGQVPALHEATLRSVGNQLAEHSTLTMSHPTCGNAHFYHTVVREVLAQLEATSYGRVVLYNWLYVKASYYEQGPAAFLDNVLTFVSDTEIAREYDLLRANLLAQAIWHMQQQPEPVRPLLEAIRTFAEGHLVDRRGQAIRMAA